MLLLYPLLQLIAPILLAVTVMHLIWCSSEWELLYRHRSPNAWVFLIYFVISGTCSVMVTLAVHILLIKYAIDN